MSAPAKPETTDLGGDEIKLGPRTPRAPRDLNNPLDVVEIAENMIAGLTRRGTMVSVEETFALARLAYAGFLVVGHVLEVIELDDRNAPVTEIKAALRQAVRAAKDFPERFKCPRG